MSGRLRATQAAAVSAVLLIVACTSGNVPALVDTAVDGDGQPADAQATFTDSETQTPSGSIPENPGEQLPDTIDPTIPDDSTLVAPDYAATPSGELLEVETGQNVTDPQLVGTADAPPDPMAKTDGKSFIPVELSEVEAAGAQENETVHTASLQNSEYGAYWGTYNGTQAFFYKDGTLFAQQAKGVVDVSVWQGNIDWAAAKQSGVEGAIIRIGYGWGNGLDVQAQRNINECKRLGIPFGVYLYSYAYDSNTGAQEGANTAALLQQAGVKPSDLAYPVYYDLEAWTWTGHTPPTSPSVYEGIVNSWYGKLQAAGYNNLGVYSYTNYLNTALNASSIHAKVSWVAQYGQKNTFTYKVSNHAWQYWSSGRVNGISGYADLNAFWTPASVCGTKPKQEPSASNVDTLAVRRDSAYFFKYSISGGEADMVVCYGKASDTALVGDWNGDGVDTLAMRRGSTYHIKNSLSGGQADQIIAFGKSTDQVLVGDWNGDGKDTLAVRRGSVYFFKNSISGGQADRVIAYGKPGDQVLVGDWNGDEQDSLAVRRKSVYHFKNSINGGQADKVIAYGKPDDKVLVGDWV